MDQFDRFILPEKGHRIDSGSSGRRPSRSLSEGRSPGTGAAPGLLPFGPRGPAVPEERPGRGDEKEIPNAGSCFPGLRPSLGERLGLRPECHFCNPPNLIELDTPFMTDRTPVNLAY